MHTRKIKWGIAIAGTATLLVLAVSITGAVLESESRTARPKASSPKGERMLAGVSARVVDSAARVQSYAGGFSTRKGPKLDEESLEFALADALDRDELLGLNWDQWWETELWMQDRRRDTDFGLALRDCTWEYLDPEQICDADLSFVVVPESGTTFSAENRAGRVDFVRVVEDADQPPNCGEFSECVAKAWVGRRGEFNLGGRSAAGFTHTHSSRNIQFTDDFVQESGAELASILERVEQLKAESDPNDLFAQRRIRFLEMFAATAAADIKDWKEIFG